MAVFGSFGSRGFRCGIFFVILQIIFNLIILTVKINTTLMKKIYSFLVLLTLCAVNAKADTPILGTIEASVERMYQFVKSQNSSFDRSIAENFHAVGQVYGLRGDIALCQSIIETGWFKYTGGTAVTADDHNYCGLGVTTLGEKGCQFGTVKEGVTAQIQHLYAYACTKALPAGETLVDPRYKYVTRGIAPNWEDLGSGKWAAAAGYGEAIIEMYNDMMAFNVSGEETPSNPGTTTTGITASTTSVNLSGEVGSSPAPYVDVTITGTNLPSDIIYNSNSSSVSVSTLSGWNARTGGTLRLTLNTNYTLGAGTYTGYVAVQSGTSTTYRVEINFTVTLTSSSSETPGTSTELTLPTTYTTDWCYSAVKGNSVSWMNPANDYTRNMALKGDNLYVVQRDPDNSTGYIRIVNASTGALKGSLPSTGISSDAYQFASVGNMGGTIVACNLAYGASSTLKVYSWSSDTSSPSVVLETSSNHGARMGDVMSVSGTITNGKIYFASNGDYVGKIYVYTVTAGVASTTPAVISLKDASGNAYDFGGTYAVIEVKANEDGTFWATGKSGTPALFSATGSLIRELSKTAIDDNVSGTSYCPFTFGKYQLAAVVTYATGVQQGYLNLIDITSGEASAVKLKGFDKLGASGVSNGTFVTTALASVEDNKIHLWVLIPKQGVAKYTAIGTGSVNDIIADGDDCRIVINNGAIEVTNATVSNITLVSLTGAVVASVDGETMDAGAVQPGVYVVVATLNNGTRVTGKIALK